MSKTILTPDSDFEMVSTPELLRFLKWQIETELGFAGKCSPAEKKRVMFKVACLLSLKYMVMEVSK